MLVTGQVDFGDNIVMILKKPQAMHVANQIISHRDLRNRFILSLQRQEALTDLYLELNIINLKKDEIISNQDLQIANLEEQKFVITEENETLVKINENIRRFAFSKGLGIGIGIGAIGTGILIIIAN